MTTPNLCSAISSADEPLAGSAAFVPGWLCIEYTGGWGRDVLDGAALGSELADELGARAERAGLRVMFIRRPGRSEASRPGSSEASRPGSSEASLAPRTVLISRSHPNASYTEQLRIGPVSELLDVDLTAFGEVAPGIGERVSDPAVLVCAHGRRDQCCALFGRPMASHLMRALPDASVWECSHTGGHRFAPSMILLPTGYTYGRLSPQESVEAVVAAQRAEVYLPGLRGRSCWTPTGQAAEIAVRQTIRASRDDLSVCADGSSAVVSHRDGRRWQVQTAPASLAPRPASCGAAPKPVEIRLVQSVARLPDR